MVLLLGAAFAYIKKCKEVNDLGEEDFDDLWDGEEENPEVSSLHPVPHLHHDSFRFACS